jgi:hypothetical protein
MSAKKINIDWKVVDKYLQSQCSGAGIASILGINENTLYRHCKVDNGEEFEAYSRKKKGEGKELLRAKQFKTAMGDNNGAVTMQIWLGKQYLEQKEKQELTGKDGTPLQSQIPPIIINVKKRD